MTKGEVSTELTKKLADGYSTWCGSCKTHHLGDQLTRLAALPGGARLVPGADVATLTPLARWSGVPAEARGTGASSTGLVRLLARSDPWLLARDRAVVVPTKAHQKVVWPVLGAPGVVLVDGEVAGVWRTKATAKRLTLTVTPFAELTKKVRDAVTEEAAGVGALRGIEDVEVVVGG